MVVCRDDSAGSPLTEDMQLPERAHAILERGQEPSQARSLRLGAACRRRLRNIPAAGPDEARLHCRSSPGTCSCSLSIAGGRSTAPSASLTLVRVGDCPARCPYREVEALKAMIDGHGFVRLPEKPSPPSRRVFVKGAAVKIIGGPLPGRHSAAFWIVGGGEGNPAHRHAGRFPPDCGSRHLVAAQ